VKSEKIILVSHPLMVQHTSQSILSTEGSPDPAQSGRLNSSKHVMNASTPPHMGHAADPLESTIGRISLPSKSIQFLKTHNPVTCMFVLLFVLYAPTLS